MLISDWISDVFSSDLAGMLLWPVVLLAGVRLALFGRFGSTHALVDDWYNHAQYLPLFLLGFWLARADVVWDRMRALRWTALWLALASYAFLAWYMGRYSGTDLPPDAQIGRASCRERGCPHW